jgi:hypothetical protein
MSFFLDYEFEIGFVLATVAYVVALIVNRRSPLYLVAWLPIVVNGWLWTVCAAALLLSVLSAVHGPPRGPETFGMMRYRQLGIWGLPIFPLSRLIFFSTIAVTCIVPRRAAWNRLALLVAVPVTIILGVVAGVLFFILMVSVPRF